MAPGVWQRVKELVDRAVDLPPGERSAFLDHECPDTAMREEVESLIASYQDASTIMEKPAVPNLLQAVSEDSLEGRRIGPYLVLFEVGRGGMGTVYRAIRADDEFQKQVAIKLVKRGLDSEAIQRRFRNERQILASLDHPFIARMLDGGTTENGSPYFVMEFIEGQNILDFAESQKLTREDRIRLFRKVCSAVAYAHRNLVVHRDLKPGNIMMTSDGEPKLLDFGIAKLLVAEMLNPADDLSATHKFRALTPDYASPEQLRGGRITTASDIYSLGVILHELITGTRPPRSAESHKLLTKLPGDLDAVVSMALREEPERRYSSVEQFSDDLLRYLGGRPVIARKDTVTYRLRRFVQRNRFSVAAGALVVLSLVAGIVATRWQAERARRRFVELRQIANAFLFEIDGSISRLPGATPARERIVQLGLTYLDGLADESTGDPALQRELAAAYQKVGDILGGSFNANLGRSADALASYRKALRIRQGLYERDRKSVEARRELAQSLSSVGDMLLAVGEVDQSILQMQESIRLREQVAAEQPDDATALKEQAAGYAAIVRPLVGKDDWAKIADYRRREAAIWKKLADRGEPLALMNWASAHSRLGWALSHLPMRDGRKEYEESIAVQEEYLKKNPNDAQVRFEMARSYAQIGILHEQRNELAQALRQARRALEERKKMHEADPQDIRVKNFLADSYRTMARLHVAQGKPSEGLPYAHEAIALNTAVAAIDPNDVFAHTALGLGYSVLGQVHKARAKEGGGREALENARDAFRKSLGLIEPIERRGKLNTRFFAGARLNGEMLRREIWECETALTAAAPR
ncbi:MAG: protein kinase [Bryobacteraceae bacterium]|nr:protein kinase [Bryobacteraceae bacterium]